MDVAAQCENLGKTEKGGKPSVLKDKTYEALRTFSWLKVVEEGHRRCPDVIDFILTISQHENGDLRKIKVCVNLRKVGHPTLRKLSTARKGL